MDRQTAAALLVEIEGEFTPLRRIAMAEVDTTAGMLRVSAVRLAVHPALPNPHPYEVVVLDGDGADLVSEPYADESLALAAHARWVDRLREVGAEEVFGPPWTLHREEGDRPTVPVAVPKALAREARFTVPVQLTPAAWRDAVQWTDDDDTATGTVGQSESGRLWDVLHMARLAVPRGPGQPTICRTFPVSRIPRGIRYPGDDEVDNDEWYENLRLVFLVAVVAGVGGQRRVTISLATE